MNLWVDVDDTLVIYDDDGKMTHPAGIHYGTAWKVNEPLLAGIRAFRMIYPDAMIVLWSGGGVDYARTWRDRLLADVDAHAFGKNPQIASLIKEDDIVVDDYVDFKCPARVYGPHEWPLKEGL
jgi:hypothetical protein